MGMPTMVSMSTKIIKHSHSRTRHRHRDNHNRPVNPERRQIKHPLHHLQTTTLAIRIMATSKITTISKGEA